MFQLIASIAGCARGCHSGQKMVAFLTKYNPFAWLRKYYTTTNKAIKFFMNKVI